MIKSTITHSLYWVSGFISANYIQRVVDNLKGKTAIDGFQACSSALIGVFGIVLMTAGIHRIIHVMFEGDDQQ